LQDIVLTDQPGKQPEPDAKQHVPCQSCLDFHYSSIVYCLSL